MAVFLEHPFLVFPPPFFSLILREPPFAVRTDEFT
jgi:hypothetical protein